MRLRTKNCESLFSSRNIECGELTFIKVVHEPLFAGDTSSPSSAEDISDMKI
jgi:hypothetical protein